MLNVEVAPRKHDLAVPQGVEPGDCGIDLDPLSRPRAWTRPIQQHVVPEVAPLLGLHPLHVEGGIGFGHPLAYAFVATVRIPLRSANERGVKLCLGINVRKHGLGVASIPGIQHSNQSLPRNTARAMSELLSTDALRAQFPGLSPEVAALDGAAGTQVPQAVVDAVAEALEAAGLGE